MVEATFVTSGWPVNAATRSTAGALENAGGAKPSEPAAGANVLLALVPKSVEAAAPRRLPNRRNRPPLAAWPANSRRWPKCPVH